MNIAIDRNPIDNAVQPPGLYNLVCKADTGHHADITALSVVAHVIENHVGVGRVAAAAQAASALRQGREVIKTGLTKEIGDTLVQACNRCSCRAHFNSFDFVLEKQ